MPAGIKANSDGSAAIQVGGTDVITLTSGGAATFVTSPTTVQAGTAAAPSITFSGDTNTGIYSPGADTVAIATGGTAAIYANSSQNVGIGTTSPATKFEVVQANTGISGWFMTGQFSAANYPMARLAATSPNKVSGFGNDGDGSLKFFVNGSSSAIGSQIMALNADSTATFLNTISVGNAAPSTSGAGITFPATQSASSNANTLDDYEEGTFTPTLAAGFSVAPTSYSNQLGRYTKIGRIVYFEIDIDANGATANATGVQFGGLPFTSAVAPYGAVTLGYQITFNTNTSDTYLVNNSNTVIQIYTNAGASRAGNAAGIDINTRIVFSGWYTVA